MKGSEVKTRTTDELSPCVSYFNATHRTKIKRESEQAMADWMILHP